MSKFFDETMQGLLEAIAIETGGNEYGHIINVEQYAKDSRLTESSNGKIYNYKRMFEAVKQLGRPLTAEEAEKYRIK